MHQKATCLRRSRLGSEQLLGVQFWPLVDRVQDESVWLCSPDFTDVLLRREVTECIKSASVIVGMEEVGRVRAKLAVAIVVIALHGCVFDIAVYALTWSLVQGCLGFAKRCSMPFTAQIMSYRISWK